MEEGFEELLRYHQTAVPLDNRIVRHKHQRKRMRGGKRLTTKPFRWYNLRKINNQDVM